MDPLLIAPAKPDPNALSPLRPATPAPRAEEARRFGDELRQSVDRPDDRASRARQADRDRPAPADERPARRRDDDAPSRTQEPDRGREARRSDRGEQQRSAGDDTPHDRDGRTDDTAARASADDGPEQPVAADKRNATDAGSEAADEPAVFTPVAPDLLAAVAPEEDDAAIASFDPDAAMPTGEQSGAAGIPAPAEAAVELAAAAPAAAASPAAPRATERAAPQAQNNAAAAATPIGDAAPSMPQVPEGEILADDPADAGDAVDGADPSLVTEGDAEGDSEGEADADVARPVRGERASERAQAVRTAWGLTGDMPAARAARTEALGGARTEPLTALLTGDPALGRTADATPTVRLVAATPGGPVASTPVHTLAFHIARHLDNGINRFEIRLDPPELGRVDVTMEVDRDGGVRVHLTVERAEALDFLQRDARALERALADAGLDADAESVSFSLDAGSDQPGDDAADGDGEGESSVGAAGADDDPDEALPGTLTASGTGRIDVRI